MSGFSVFLCGSGHSLTHGGASGFPSIVFCRVLELSLSTTQACSSSPSEHVLGAHHLLQALHPPITVVRVLYAKGP